MPLHTDEQLICYRSLETNFLNHGGLNPPIFSNNSAIQRPTACMAESAMKIGGATVVFKNCFQQTITEFGLRVN